MKVFEGKRKRGTRKIGIWREIKTERMVERDRGRHKERDRERGEWGGRV